MAGPPKIADVVSLLSAWGGPVEPVVLEALNDLGTDTVMRAFTAAIADLLASAAREAEGDDALSTSLLVERTVALARSGQMATAAALAEPVLGRAGLSPAVRVALLRSAVLAYTSDARVAEVDRLLESIDRSLYPPEQLQRFEATRSFARVLCGDPVARAQALAADVSPDVTPETGTLPLVMQSIASMLAADGHRAVMLVESAADGYRALARQAGEELASVDIWPAQFRLHTSGRHDARRCVDDWHARTVATDQVWVEPYHQVNSAMIALAFGELYDASAEFDAAIELAGQTGQGWISLAVAARARIDIVRDELDAAADRIARFREGGRPDSLGLRAIDLALGEIAAARGEPNDHLERSWSTAVAEDNRLWMLLGGLDHLRAARRVGDVRLAELILTGLVGLDAPPALSYVPHFARAAVDGDVDSLVAAVDRCRELSGVLDAARLRGDVALLASGLGSPMTRELGTGAVGDLSGLGAHGEERILVAELRGRGVRLGVRGARNRPTAGWKSLTPTEERIVALVAQGVSGPEIGRALYISPRTVQTHVSHALGKLGLSNRLELAMAYATRDH